MTGGTAGHATLQANLAVALVGRLRGKPCKFYGSDLKIQVADDQHPLPGRHGRSAPRSSRNPKIVRNPVVIFEVLSPEHNRRNDRIVKAREYQATPSVQRYVMLEQDSIDATVHVRSQDGWSVLVLKQDDILSMPEIGAHPSARGTLRRPDVRGPSGRRQR